MKFFTVWVNQPGTKCFPEEIRSCISSQLDSLESHDEYYFLVNDPLIVYDFLGHYDSRVETRIVLLSVLINNLRDNLSSKLINRLNDLGKLLTQSTKLSSDTITCITDQLRILAFLHLKDAIYLDCDIHLRGPDQLRDLKKICRSHGGLVVGCESDGTLTPAIIASNDDMRSVLKAIAYIEKMVDTSVAQYKWGMFGPTLLEDTGLKDSLPFELLFKLKSTDIPSDFNLRQFYHESPSVLGLHIGGSSRRSKVLF